MFILRIRKKLPARVRPEIEGKFFYAVKCNAAVSFYSFFPPSSQPTGWDWERTESQRALPRNGFQFSPEKLGAPFIKLSAGVAGYGPSSEGGREEEELVYVHGPRREQDEATKTTTKDRPTD